MQASVDRMTERIAGIMDGHVHSAWLYGSVVLDDFRPGWSDIDLIVLTSAEITESRAGELLTLRQTLCGEEPGNPYYRSFEGIIAEINEYRTGKYTRLVYWGTSGQRVADSFAPDAFSRFELAKYGRSVCGEADRSIFPLPGREEMTAAVRSHYEAIRESLYSCGWLFDIARCVYTLRYSDVIAKTEAGLWALGEGLFPDDEPLRRAVEIRLHPLRYRDREDVRQWLKGLGPVVQRYADVLEKELEVLR